ncbi:hypothetical protein SBA6_500064 [Candidatus Sulfopaludibacter sp. SbA6]|nr:hypothetical protein SBA6_500064 [Candidatus Sulfopaludibacter sp. SbA6]
MLTLPNRPDEPRWSEPLVLALKPQFTDPAAAGALRESFNGMQPARGQPCATAQINHSIRAWNMMTKTHSLRYRRRYVRGTAAIRSSAHVGVRAPR